MASTLMSKPKIAVYAYTTEESAASLRSNLDDDTFLLNVFSTHSDLMRSLEGRRNEVDCIILEVDNSLTQLLETLRSRSILLPTVLLKSGQPEIMSDSFGFPAYHTAIFCLESRQIDQLPSSIDTVIGQFLEISAERQPSEPAIKPDSDAQDRECLVGQQRRLAEKLKERLGYLGVYYKRDPNGFLQHMSDSDKDEFLAELKQSYRDIILNYFTDDPLLNQKIDNYINSAFFADVSVVQVVEIHMELMDSFSKQLKLEGRSDEMLLDYRLALIDTLANLCEIYRRSIPRQT
ncbi:MAG: circadian clock protein KaiA [Elainellaceae cyanobacterium]